MTTEELTVTLLILSTFATGLSAGLLYGFACAVMPGLKDVDDRAFLAVMQSVNRRILNGWFLATFVGAPVLTIGAAATAFLGGNADQQVATSGAALLSLLSIGITAVVNVPLNNMLDASSDNPSVVEASTVRRRFERRWTRGNVARSAASAAAFGGLVWALANGG